MSEVPKEVTHDRSIPSGGRTARGVQDGTRVRTHGRAVESHFRSFSRNSAAPQGWSSACAYSALRGGHPVDSAQRRSVERFTQVLSLRHDLLASPQGVDGSGHLGTSLVAAVAEAGLPRQHQARGVLCRRNVFLGKKGGEKVGKTKRGKGTKIMVLTDGNGLPIGADTASASPHEVTLIELLLEKRVLRKKPRRLIYDEAADSDPLRQRLHRRGIELVCRHRRNRVKPPTQDRRKLRRFRRRWKVERSISWLQNFRRLVTRYEFYAHLFHGFVQLACLVVVLGRF